MTPSRLAAAVLLAGLGALHLAWAAGSPWPAADRRQLAHAVVGADRMPPPLACAGVGAGLVVAAGASLASPRLRLLAALTFTARGVVGGGPFAKAITGSAPERTFRRLDAVLYRPLCATLAALLTR